MQTLENTSSSSATSIQPQHSINTHSSISPSTSSQSPKPPPSHRCLKCNLSHPTPPSPWIHCALCSSPWHWSCVTMNQLDPIDVIEKWFCKTCTQRDPSLVPIYKEPPRKSARVRPKKTSYNDSSADPESNPDRFINRAIGQKNIIDAFDVPASGPHKPFRKMKASELTMEWLVQDEHAMTEPVVIDDQEGLCEMGMKMPSKELTIGKIAELVGTDTPVEVIDVASQAELSRWTLGQWARYYEHPRRDQVRNVISLEVSETPLGSLIQLPRIVTDMDWVHTVWPSHMRGHGSGSYPKVQKYCLMSVARCWTDWHIDFAGSSVFYHILRGAKTFYFIRPTVANLAKYEKWSGSSKLQESTWLGDQVNVVYKVSLTAGQTMMIPTGWIHAVHTPMDSLVFGGNFLHSLNIPTQLRVHQIENATKVPKKFRFPFFIHILWFVLSHYYQKLDLHTEQVEPTRPSSSSDLPPNLDSFSPIPNRLLSGLSALSEFLLTQTDPSDSHPVLSSKDLLSHVEGHLKTERISNVRQTVLTFQTLLNKLRMDTSSSPNGSTVKPGSSEDLPPSSNPVSISRIDEHHKGEDKMDKPAETFKSPLHITIKRKICTPSTERTTGTKDSVSDNKTTKSTTAKAKNGTNSNNNKTHEAKKRRADERVEVKSSKAKQNARSESKTNTDSKKKITSTTTMTSNKLTGGEILLMSNPTPTNEIQFERRKRPRFDDSKQQEIKNDVNDDGDESKPKKKMMKESDYKSELKTIKKDDQDQTPPSSNKTEEQQDQKIQHPEKLVKIEESTQENNGVSMDVDQDAKIVGEMDLKLDEDGEDVEVRTTHALNSVVRKWVDPARNKVVYETRTVKTIIEKVYFDP